MTICFPTLCVHLVCFASTYTSYRPDHPQRFVLCNGYVYYRKSLYTPTSNTNWIQTWLIHPLPSFAVEHFSCRLDTMINKLVSSCFSNGTWTFERLLGSDIIGTYRSEFLPSHLMPSYSNFGSIWVRRLTTVAAQRVPLLPHTLILAISKMLSLCSEHQKGRWRTKCNSNYADAIRIQRALESNLLLIRMDRKMIYAKWHSLNR